MNLKNLALIKLKINCDIEVFIKSVILSKSGNGVENRHVIYKVFLIRAS